jgi:flagellar hook-length control protein FliK
MIIAVLLCFSTLSTREEYSSQLYLYYYLFLAIGIIMQQLNILPINTGKHVDTKDNVSALSSLSNDDFSQHIESQLAKNKDISNKTSEEEVSNADTKKDETQTEYKTNVADQPIQTEESVSIENASTGEQNLATDTQEVAAIGNSSEIKSNKTKTDEVTQSIDDPESLMSFLTKADNTLVDKGSVDKNTVDSEVVKINSGNTTNTAKLNELSEEQRIKNEMQQLLKANNLTSDLSGVAKAIASSSETESEYLFEQEKSENVTEEFSKERKEGKESTDTNQSLTTKSVVDANSLSTTTLDEKSINNSKNGEQASIEQAKTKAAASAGSQEIITNAPTPIEANDENVISQQKFTSENVDIDANDNQDAVKSLKGNKEKTQTDVTQTSGNDKNALENESVIDEQVALMQQNENVQRDKGVTKVVDNTISVNARGQQPSAQSPILKDTPKNTSSESLEQSTSESDIDSQLSSKASEQFVRHSEEGITESNKEASAKVIAKPNTDFSYNANAAEAINREAQASYDRIDEHAIEIVNPTGSVEVSQSQKTNIQLHHETISIFRKDFSDAVKDKVMLIISQKLQQFDITLDPPELGNMQVRVNLQGEQASVNFIVQNQQAKEALDQNMNKLKDMLAEQGVDVGDTNVEQQSQQSDNSSTNDDKNHHINTNTADAGDVVEHNLSVKINDTSTQGVDYYA